MHDCGPFAGFYRNCLEDQNSQYMEIISIQASDL